MATRSSLGAPGSRCGRAHPVSTRWGFSMPQINWGIFYAPERGHVPDQSVESCKKFFPGHNLHYIQSRLALESEWSSAIVRYLGSSVFEVSLDTGEILHLINHNTQKLRNLIQRLGESGHSYQVKYRCLKVRGQAMFSMSREPLVACHP